MNISILFIIALYAGSAIILKRQEKRHEEERLLFYTFDQLQHYRTMPKRDTIDSLLISFVGATLLEIGAFFLWVAVSTYSKLHQSPDENSRRLFDEVSQGQFLFSALFIGGGIALLILGARSVIANMRYKKIVSQQEQAISQ